MLEEFSKFKTKTFDKLTDTELLREREIAYKHYSFLQECKSLKPVLASSMMGKIEWYISVILEEMDSRGLPGGFKYVKKKELKIVCKHVRIMGYIIPKI